MGDEFNHVTIVKDGTSSLMLQLWNLAQNWEDLTEKVEKKKQNSTISPYILVHMNPSTNLPFGICAIYIDLKV